MIISWLGQSCFKIQSKVGIDNITIAIDPFTKKYGLKVPNFDADICAISHTQHDDHNNVEAIKGSPFVINAPGEYDVKGVFVNGIASFHDDKNGEEFGENTIFRIEVEGITITHLGDLGHLLHSKELEILSGTDILLVPVGGKYTLDAKNAVKVINQIEPRMIIPMHYKIDGLKIDDISGVDKFVREIGLKPTEELKLKITKKDLPQDDMELVILQV
ncbi:MBL fold metallo-hydrolase [Candidatus Parcubacteria bacterium]|nr:MBL fold metallo-hydrolase [Candidatus Parcubacteria bacterium]